MSSEIAGTSSIPRTRESRIVEAPQATPSPRLRGDDTEHFFVRAFPWPFSFPHNRGHHWEDD